jgi:hypothetical protein
MILESFLERAGGATERSSNSGRQLVMEDITVLCLVIFDSDEKCTSRIEGAPAADGMSFQIKV